MNRRKMGGGTPCLAAEPFSEGYLCGFFASSVGLVDATELFEC